MAPIFRRKWQWRYEPIVIVCFFLSLLVIKQLDIIRTPQNLDSLPDNAAEFRHAVQPYSKQRLSINQREGVKIEKEHENENTAAAFQQLSSKIDSMSTALEQLWCLTQEVMSSGGFCVTSKKIFTGGNQMFDPMMCTFIEQLVGNSSIADFGAGIGYYGMCFLRLQKCPFQLEEKQTKLYMQHLQDQMGTALTTEKQVYSWHGFDGSFNIDTLSSGFIQYADLSVEGLWLGRRWDWVMSIEVGEHITADKEDFFLDNLVRHACKGVIVTWGALGQPGHQHINNRSTDYIKKKMSTRGLTNNVEEETQLKEFISHDNLRVTSMIFRVATPKNCLE